MRFYCLCFLVIIGLSAADVPAQKFLEKPFEKWSRDNAVEIVTDSAWAKTYQSPEGSADSAAAQAGRELGQNSSGGGSDPRSIARNFGPPPVVIRLHSALPVRQALVRIQQVDNGYAKMSEADKAAFDAGRKAFLECGICKEYYVVTMLKFPDASGQSVDEGIFQTLTLADVKGHVKLVNDAGEERELVEFTPPKNSRDMAAFFFKRVDDKGAPLITPASKVLKLVFSNDFRQPKNRYASLIPKTFEFKVSKMIVGGEPAF